MIQQILNYYHDEKHGSVIAVVAGIILFLSAALIWKLFSENPIAKGLSTGFFTTGSLVLIIGISGVFYNNGKIRSVELLKDQKEQSLQQNEITRMDKVMNKTFKYAFITFGILMAAAMALTLITTSWYWKGLGIALIFFIALITLSDTFSMHRNGNYLETIKALKF